MATILIADDEAPIRDLLAQFFDDAGYRTFVATHGAEALALVKTESIDLVITDFMMPIMDGIELCRQLKARGPIAVILMSAADLPRLRAAGADAFIAKPFDLDALEAQVQGLLALPPEAD